MSYACKLENLPHGFTAYVRARTQVGGLPELLSQAYAEIESSVQKAGLKYSGPPYVLYFNIDMDDLDVEIGFPINKAFNGISKVKGGEFPAGRHATCIHIGPYPEIETAYKALSEWMQIQGVTPKGFAYEFYLNDPNETPEAQLETKILFPLLET
jgi:effector-binding domain-containing protein